MVAAIIVDIDTSPFYYYYNMISNMLYDGKWRYVINENENLFNALETKVATLEAFDPNLRVMFNQLKAWYDNESS